jgi:transcriptional antiterminator NusG
MNQEEITRENIEDKTSQMSELKEQKSSEDKSKLKQEDKSDKKKSEKKSVIFVVKVTTNKEDKALDIVAKKIKKKNLNVYAIARPHGLRGYIFLEAPDRENAEEAVFNLPYVKGIIPKVISYDEIKPMLEPVAADIKIEKEDIVEMISEPFKKEKAKVVRVDKAKGEAIVSLLGAAVPIPVTVKLDNLRVIRREEEKS